MQVAGAAAEHDDASLLEVADGAAANERLGDGAHLDGGHHAGHHTRLLEGVMEGERIDDRREHPHVIGGGAVHRTARAGRHAAKDIPTAQDRDGGLDAHGLNLGDISGDLRGYGRVDTVVLLAHQRFAGQFQENALVRGRRGGHRRIIDRGRLAMGDRAISPDAARQEAASPTFKRAKRITVTAPPKAISRPRQGRRTPSSSGRGWTPGQR